MRRYSPNNNITNETNQTYTPKKDISLKENKNQAQTSNSSKRTLQSKKIILRNNNTQSLNNQIDKKDIQRIEIGLSNDDNLDNPKILEEKKNVIYSIKEDENENEKGYLEDDLDDEDNKKIYLRVIKRLEKTLGIPVTGVNLSGEFTENLEIEEDLRPILISNILISKDNKNPINNELNNNKIINDVNISNNNNYENIIYEDNEEQIKEEIKEKDYNKPIIIKRPNKTENINDDEIRGNVNIKENKYINNINNNQSKQINTRYNINQTSKDKKILDSTPKKTNERISKTVNNSYTKNNPSKNVHENIYIHQRNISYENSNQFLDKNQEQQIQSNSILNNNQQNSNNNYNNYNYNSNENENEKKHIKSNSSLASNQKNYISKTIPLTDNSVIIPDMQRGKDIFIKENESELNSGKVKTRTYARGGKFNNVQSTYVVYSTKDKQKGFNKGNYPDIIDNKNKKMNTYSNDLITSTPIKKNNMENKFEQKNYSYNKNIIDNNDNLHTNNYRFNSPNETSHKQVNKINFDEYIDNSKNKSLYSSAIKKDRNYNNKTNDRNSYENNYRNTNYNTVNRNSVKSNKYYTYNSRQDRSSFNSNQTYGNNVK